MASNSGRRYGSSGRSGPRKRVVIGADETVRVRYHKNQPEVEAERRSTTRQSAKVATKRAGVSRPAPSKQGQRMSTAKREERERRQRVLKWRRVAFMIGAVALVIAAIWTAGAIYRAPVFTVKNVEIQGARHLSRTEVLALAKIPNDAALLRLPSSAIRKRLVADPWVMDAGVSRDFPSTVVIRLTERRPAAVVDMGGTDLWVVSTDGYWLGKRGEEETSTVVVRDVNDVKPVVGRRAASKELANAIKVAVGISPELRAMTRAISAPSVEKTALITNDDVEIYFGEATQIKAKDRVAREILAREKGKVVYINVRVVDRPTWRGLDSSQ